MRTSILIILITIGLFSCTSINKLVEQGKYDAAFDMAINKLAGKKNKKTEHIIALEKAHARLTNDNLSKIALIRHRNTPEDYVTMALEYKKIMRRNNTVSHLLPLISEKGYVASFEITDYSNEIVQLELKAGQSFFEESKELFYSYLNTSNKTFAKKGYFTIQKAKRYLPHSVDVIMWEEKLRTASLINIGISIQSALNNKHIDPIIQNMSGLSFITANPEEYRMFTIGQGFRDTSLLDIMVVIDLDDIQMSQEKESGFHFIENKEILVQKEKSKKHIDTTLVHFEKIVYENITAYITEIKREKHAYISGTVSVYNKTQLLMQKDPVQAQNVFIGYGCTYQGDARALTHETKEKLDTYLESFPTDTDMMHNLVTKLSKSIEKQLSHVDFWKYYIQYI